MLATGPCELKVVAMRSQIALVLGGSSWKVAAGPPESSMSRARQSDAAAPYSGQIYHMQGWHSSTEQTSSGVEQLHQH